MRVLVINGPNLNLLGRRETGIYGDLTLEKINDGLRSLAQELGVEIEFYQSNIEGQIVDRIQQAVYWNSPSSQINTQTNKAAQGILINPGAYGHTSVAIRDALAAVALPFVEVHISNVYKRETFRHKSYLSDLASGLVVGFGANSYRLGLRGLIEHLQS